MGSFTALPDPRDVREWGEQLQREMRSGSADAASISASLGRMPKSGARQDVLELLVQQPAPFAYEVLAPVLGGEALRSDEAVGLASEVLYAVSRSTELDSRWEAIFVGALGHPYLLAPRLGGFVRDGTSARLGPCSIAFA